MALIQPHGDSHLLQVHADKGAADVQARVGLDLLQRHGVAEAVIGGGGEGAAGLGLGLHVHDLRARHGLMLHDQRPVQMLAALGSDVDALGGKDTVQAIKNGLGDLRRGPAAHTLAHYLTGAAAHHNDLPLVQVRLVHQLLGSLGRLTLYLPKQILLLQFMHGSSHRISSFPVGKNHCL